MRRWMLGVFAGLAVLALVASAFGDADWNLTGQGARSLGMGGAFIGICDDATALSWNPAGLAQLDHPEISGVFKLETHDNYWNPKSYTYNGTSYKLNYTSSNTHGVLNFVSGAFPLKVAQRNLTFALAYQQQLDFYFLSQSSDSTIKNEQTGGAYTLSPGLAYQILPQLALGVAANFWMNHATHTYTDKTDPSYNFTYDQPYSGFNMLFGAHLKEKYVKFGAVLRTPLTMKFHDDYTVLGSAYLQNKRSPVSGDFKQKLPFMYGFGVALTPTQNFTFSADLDIRPYSNMEVDDSAGVKDTLLKYPNITQLRLGMEYLLFLHQAIVPLRLGFRTDPKTYYGYKYTAANPNGVIDKQVTGIAVSFGTGLAVHHFELDGAFEYAHSQLPYNYDASYGYSPSTINWDADYMRFLMSAIFKF